MKAYLIDSTARTVTAVTWNGKLPQAYALIGCEYIEGKRLGQQPGAKGQDWLFIDEEGLLQRPIKPFFTIDGLPYPISGNGLVTGPEDPLPGEQHEPTSTLEQITARVKFVMPAEAVGLWNKQRAADKEAMREMREEGIEVIDAGIDLVIDDNGEAHS